MKIRAFRENVGPANMMVELEMECCPKVASSFLYGFEQLIGSLDASHLLDVTSPFPTPLVPKLASDASEESFRTNICLLEELAIAANRAGTTLEEICEKRGFYDLNNLPQKELMTLIDNLNDRVLDKIIQCHQIENDTSKA